MAGSRRGNKSRLNSAPSRSSRTQTGEEEKSAHLEHWGEHFGIKTSLKYQKHFSQSFSSSVVDVRHDTRPTANLAFSSDVTEHSPTGFAIFYKVGATRGVR